MFGKNTKVDLELNREVEQLLKTGGKERILPIVQAGEPVLRQQTVQYSGQLSKGTLNKLIDTMHTTMLEAPGVGLAATQIGLGLALAVVEDHVRDDEDDRSAVGEQGLGFGAGILRHHHEVGSHAFLHAAQSVAQVHGQQRAAEERERQHHDDDDERSRAKRLALQVLQRQSFEGDSCDHRLTGLESR